MHRETETRKRNKIQNTKVIVLVDCFDEKREENDLKCTRSREVCVPLDDNESANVRDMVSLDDDAATTLCRDCVGEAVGDDLSVDGVTNGVRRVVGDA